MAKKVVKILIPLLLLGDLVYSFLQYYHLPLDGDMAAVIVPSHWYQPLMDDPFGISVLLNGEQYGGTNRFFCHWFMSVYYKNVPLLLQHFVNPIQSVYLAGALLKMSIHIMMIWALSAYISGKRRIYNRDFLLAALLVTPLFQTHGYNLLMGMIEKSPTYAVFYSLPMALLLLFFLPFYRQSFFKEQKKLNLYTKIWLAIGAVVLPFSGPLIPAVVLIVGLLVLIFWVKADGKAGRQKFQFFDKIKAGLTKLSGSAIILLGIICSLSLYSIYLGTYNLENPAVNITFWERYLRIPVGLFWQFAHKPGFPLLTLAIGVNIWLIRKYQIVKKEKLMLLLRWAGLFAVIYLLLLPLGGFREYRSLIVRRDTMLPVTIVMVYYYGLSSFWLIRYLTLMHRRKYLTGLAAFLLIFTIADEPRFDYNTCEKASLEKIAGSKEKIVLLKNDCEVMAWEKMTNADGTKWNARLLEMWNITDEVRYYYQE